MVRTRAASQAALLLIAAVLFLAITVLDVTPAVTQEAAVSPSERVTRFVYIRKEPSGASPALGRMRPSESLPLVGVVPRWRQVRLSNGRTGFVSSSWTVVTPAAAAAVAASSNDQLRIHFLSIGAGTCTVVECPGPNAPPMIIDCGSFPGSRGEMAYSEDRARERVQAILSRHAAAPNVVLSHGDIDHYNWTPSVLGNVTANNIWQGGLAKSYGAAKGAFQTWLNNQKSRGAKIHRGFSKRWHNDGRPLGDRLSCGAASTYVLTVNTTTTETNAASLS